MQTVGGAAEVRTLSDSAFECVVVQFFSAVGTEQQPGEHTDNAPFCGSAAVLAKILNKGKGFPVNDGGVGVRKHFPFLF